MRQATTDGGRWVLAFDATCGRCRQISDAIDQASDGRLDVLPLADPAVRRWREQALGSAAPWVPTVLQVRADQVRAWTGPVMGARLAVRLGPRRTTRVLSALGGLGPTSMTEPAEPTGPTENSPVGRRGLLKLGTGVGVGLGLMLSTQGTAFGRPESKKLAAARAWARENQTPRAGQYDELARHELAYRHAVFTDLPVTVRSQLWKEQIRRFRVKHPELATEQLRVLDEAEAVLTEPTLYTVPSPALLRRLKDMEASAIDAFGRGRACNLLTALGPTPRTSSTSDPRQSSDCPCSLGSECNWTDCVVDCRCTVTSTGCGCFYVWPCDGNSLNWCED